MARPRPCRSAQDEEHSSLHWSKSSPLDVAENTDLDSRMGMGPEDKTLEI